MRSVKQAYGIDFSNHAVIIVKTIHSHKSFTHNTLFDGTESDDPNLLSSILKNINEESTSSKSKIAMSMAVHETFTRWLVAPFQSYGKTKKILTSLLDIQLPIPIEDCVYSFLKMQSGPNKKIETLAIAIPKDNLKSTIEYFKKQGLDPEHLAHEGLTIWSQSILELPPEHNEHRIIANLGYEHCSLSIGHGTKWLTAHSLRFKCSELLSTIDDRTSDQNTATLNHFMQRTRQLLRAHVSKASAKDIHWLWAGPGASESRLVEAIQDELKSIPCTFGKHNKPNTFLARALACRALRPGPMHLNFREHYCRHPQISKQRIAQSRKTALCSISVGLTILFMALSWTIYIQHKKGMLQKSLISHAQKLTQLKKIPKGFEVRTVKQAIQRSASATNLFLQMFQPSLTTQLQKILHTAYAHNITINSLSLDDDTVRMSGTSKEWTQCEELKKKLQLWGYEVDLDQPGLGTDLSIPYHLQGRKK